MKKIVSVTLVFLLMFSICACNKAEEVVDDLNSQISKAESNMESDASKVESDIESGVSNIESNMESDASTLESGIESGISALDSAGDKPDNRR